MGYLQAASVALCLLAPVSGPVAAPYAPIGQFGGHWGVDLAATPGTAVVAPSAGRVSFAGRVAGMLTVTIDIGKDYLVSVSYLSAVRVSRGEAVQRGQTVGIAGWAHGEQAVHLSVRHNGAYLDPEPFLGCRPFGQLHLLPPPQAGTYPGSRAQWIARGNFRSSPHRSPSGGGGGLSSVEAGSGPFHARRFTVAEGRSPGERCATSLGHDQAGCRRY